MMLAVCSGCAICPCKEFACAPCVPQTLSLLYRVDRAPSFSGQGQAIGGAAGSAAPSADAAREARAKAAEARMAAAAAK